MSEIVAAVDETAASTLLATAMSGGFPARTGTDVLGPFTVDYSVSGTLSGGGVDLIPPDVVRVADLRLDYAVALQFSFDLSSFLPDIHIPQVCVSLPCVGRICTPRIDIDWPTIRVPVAVNDFVRVTVDLTPVVTLANGTWTVAVVVRGLPALQLGPAAIALVAAVGAAITAAVLLVPGIGPFLAIAVAAITATIGVAAATGLLGRILQPLIAGRSFTIYQQPQQLQLAGAEDPQNPAVFLRLDQVTAAVDGSGGEDELVLSIDVSPV